MIRIYFQQRNPKNYRQQLIDEISDKGGTSEFETLHHTIRNLILKAQIKADIHQTIHVLIWMIAMQSNIKIK